MLTGNELQRSHLIRFQTASIIVITKIEPDLSNFCISKIGKQTGPLKHFEEIYNGKMATALYHKNRARSK